VTSSPNSPGHKAKAFGKQTGVRCWFNQQPGVHPPSPKKAAAKFARNFGFIVIILALTACVRLRLNLAPPPFPPQAIPLATPRPTASPEPTFTSGPIPVVTATPVAACPLPKLSRGQFISAGGSYTQTEPEVSGRMVCRIKRGSCGYEQLVGLLDPTIVFKQEETPPFDTEDRLIHPAMVQPLARLNQLVQAEWHGAVQLRVTDAYDSLLEHDPPQADENLTYSLHYEGRAIDLTTFPVDRNLYGRLCILAHCAGFDWVLHEGGHCHASIRATSLCNQCGE
jgi:hypothetical protein